MSNWPELVVPGPGASEAELFAYRMAYSDRSVEVHRRDCLALNAELTAKVTIDDAARAMAGFSKVLDDAGFDAGTAASAQFKLEYLDDAGFPEDVVLSAEERQAAVAWRAAVEAARVELCDKAPFVSDRAFGLVDFLEGPSDDLFIGRFSLVQAVK